jgi:hypothetical protein
MKILEKSLRKSTILCHTVTFCFDHNPEMEGRGELSDVLNWREICLEDFQTRPSSSKCFIENL